MSDEQTGPRLYYTEEEVTAYLAKHRALMVEYAARAKPAVYEKIPGYECYRCTVCGREIKPVGAYKRGNTTFARTSHLRAHAKRGEAYQPPSGGADGNHMPTEEEIRSEAIKTIKRQWHVTRTKELAPSLDALRAERAPVSGRYKTLRRMREALDASFLAQLHSEGVTFLDSVEARTMAAQIDTVTAEIAAAAARLEAIDTRYPQDVRDRLTMRD